LTSDKLESPQKASPTCALINSSASLKIAAARCHLKFLGARVLLRMTRSPPCT
jgi:hypothetical protein